MNLDSRSRTLARWGVASSVALAAFVPIASALAQAGGAEEEIQQTVARIAYIQGPASYSRGDDPGNWQDVEVNLPVTLGDRVYTGKNGRLELHTGGTRIFVAPETQVTALDLREDVRQMSVSVGTASFRVRRLADGEVFEVDTPNVSITFRRPGSYRVDVDRDGTTRVVLFEGGALGVAAGGQVDLAQGDTIEVEGTDQPRYDLVQMPPRDRWDGWVDDRMRPRQPAVAVKHVPDEVVGAEDLDEDGSWEQVPEHGLAWTPRGVSADWAPYRDGRWMWQDPWGWTWVAAERWGWAPYHYGSWTAWRNRWFWLPHARGGPYARYSPARVVFAGGAPGLYGSGGPHHVGWFPVGPREPFSPWWGHRPPVPVPPGFGFMNRGFMHAVPHAAFVGGGWVQRSFVRDRAILHGLASAPFIHGPLPFLPTPASIRMPFAPGRHGPVLRPPDMFVSRSVVTRLAPPLAPPGFQTKMGFIRENHGRPVDHVNSERLSVGQFRGARPVADIRPAIPVAGRVDFAPKRDLGQAHRVLPVAPPQHAGRVLSTHDKPIGITSPGLQSSQKPYVEARGAEPVRRGADQGFRQQQVGQKTLGPPEGQSTTGKRTVDQRPDSAATGVRSNRGGGPQQDGTKQAGQGQPQTRRGTDQASGQQGAGQKPLVRTETQSTAGKRTSDRGAGSASTGVRSETGGGPKRDGAGAPGQGEVKSRRGTDQVSGQKATDQKPLVRTETQSTTTRRNLDQGSGQTSTTRRETNQGSGQAQVERKPVTTTQRSVDRPVERQTTKQTADRPVVRQQSQTVVKQPVDRPVVKQSAPPPQKQAPPPQKQSAPPPQQERKGDRRPGR